MILNQNNGLGIRHLQVALLFLFLLVAHAIRANMSFAIVAMLDKDSSNPNFMEFDWDRSTQSIILSSFVWGYVVAQIPAGPLARKFGAKNIMIISFGIGSILCALTPIGAVYGGWEAVIVLRFLQGTAQSCVFPCTHTILSKWVPMSERSRLSVICYAGAQLGTVFMLSVSGVLASSITGWPGIFYVSGGFGILWSILFYLYGGNCPTEYKKITEEEKFYILNESGVSASHEQPNEIPWKGILTSIPFWALVITHCGNNWGFWLLLTNIPIYMKNILHFDIKSNALLSALPYLVTWILSNFFSFLSDYLCNKNYLTTEKSRKMFNSIGYWMPMILLIILGYIPEEQNIVGVIILTLAVGFTAAAMSGYLVNHLDLSPNFAGILMGMTNFVANCFAILAPLVVGFIVPDEENQSQWRIVFFITGAIYFITNLVFIIFGRATVQPWNNYSKRKNAKT